MMCKHLLLALAVLAVCAMGTVQAASLDPGVVEAAVGDGTGTYLDVAGIPYTRGGMTSTINKNWDKWPYLEGYTPLEIIQVDGNGNGMGEGQFSEGTWPGQDWEITQTITGLAPNTTYDLWGVGYARSDSIANPAVGMGFEWGTTSGGGDGDLWVDLVTATGSINVTNLATDGIYDCYAVPGTSQVTSDGSGQLVLYFNETVIAGSVRSALDGVVLQAAEVPEPSTFVLMIGLGMLFLLRRFRR